MSDSPNAERPTFSVRISLHPTSELTGRHGPLASTSNGAYRPHLVPISGEDDPSMLGVMLSWHRPHEVFPGDTFDADAQFIFSELITPENAEHGAQFRIVEGAREIGVATIASRGISEG